MSDASLKYRVERLEEMLEFVKSVSMWRSTDPLVEQRGRAIARMIGERLGESPDYVPVSSWRELMTELKGEDDVR